ncbi:fungal-specific transcription factor domain-containing protein [Pseudomassariella vexata]|uniref:Fungal-specific transcription factor domain-domain-containing protein n=1 Tax=Pseudomassariella vexata TaxID=1141098 RepID=A0A1Y2DKF3_9PEZI|nr:fungal-specific transcription factor domain-containing protein [Pseudomassariella vexata]ORY59702.1 fungal-specific transcription factor domain-domain-containing protein [Pseudomassariella vexata]
MPQSPAENGNNQQQQRGQVQASFKVNAKPKTRSRNGCPTCKAKRLKCDENKPFCNQCIRNGRKCPGYNQAFRWSTKHEKALIAKARGPSNLKDLVTATSNTITPHEALAGDTSNINQGQPIEVDPAGANEQGQGGCADLNGLPDGGGMLTPMLDNIMMPEFEYGIEDLLQDIWEEQPVACGPSPPADDVGHDAPFIDQSLPLESSLSPKSPFSFWSAGFSFSPSDQPMFPQIPRTITDRSSLLVEEWFKHVCSMWSSYDSEVNLNRKLASDTWTRSEAVMNCLQSMSATCLSSQMPQMRQVAISYLKGAIRAIQRDLKAAGQGPTLGAFPTDLLLALCCVGTAACWINTKEIGGQFLREAKTLLKRINQESDRLSAQDRQTLSFFNNSLIYWNMLVAVVSDEPDDLGTPRLKEPQDSQVSGPIIPHPWTGVSATAQRLFAQAIKLCRRFRRHLKKDSISTMRSLQTALRDIKEAQEIEEELLGLEHYSVHEISDTGDRMTPRSHFVDVAEGYRLASLLQLYQTFPDLVARRLPEDTTESSVVPWDRWIVPLSLRLVNTLKKIPPSSGTRCIQPLLYLSASTGLRFDVETLIQQQQLQEKQPNQPRDHSPIQDTFNETNGMPSTLEMEMSAFMDLEPKEDPPISLTRMSIEVSHARRFIMERLSALEHNLPPAPVLVAKDLVKAIWAGYDSEQPGTNYTHWIDVMEASNLRTIFG